MVSLRSGLLSGGGDCSGRHIGGVACRVGEATGSLWQATYHFACSQKSQPSCKTSSSGYELHPKVRVRPYPILLLVCLNLW